MKPKERGGMRWEKELDYANSVAFLNASISWGVFFYNFMSLSNVSLSTHSFSFGQTPYTVCFAPSVSFWSNVDVESPLSKSVTKRNAKL